jgi:hypothetical protein
MHLSVFGNLIISVGSSVLRFNILLVTKGWIELEATALCLLRGHASGASFLVIWKRQGGFSLVEERMLFESFHGARFKFPA